MSHHIYTTPGFIVHSTSQAEAGKYYLLFTRDLGMIGATAQGVRLSQSKLRYYTQDFAYSLFSVVKGKEVWRMTGAKEIEGRGEVLAENRKLYVRVLYLLKRLLPGEEKNEHLFGIIDALYLHLTQTVTTKEERESIEYITVLRILHSLGYVRSDIFLDVFCMTTDLSKGILDDLNAQKDFVIGEINAALKESQL